MGFLGDSDGKESPCNARDLGSIPGLGRSLGEENRYHSSILAWRIPWTEEPGGQQSMGLQRVGHECQSTTNSTRAAHQLALPLLPDPGKTKGTRVLALREPANLVQDPEKAEES